MTRASMLTEKVRRLLIHDGNPEDIQFFRMAFLLDTSCCFSMGLELT